MKLVLPRRMRMIALAFVLSIAGLIGALGW
jgi:hypothetical protein